MQGGQLQVAQAPASRAAPHVEAADSGAEAAPGQAVHPEKQRPVTKPVTATYSAPALAAAAAAATALEDEAAKEHGKRRVRSRGRAGKRKSAKAAPQIARGDYPKGPMEEALRTLDRIMGWWRTGARFGGTAFHASAFVCPPAWM